MADSVSPQGERCARQIFSALTASATMFLCGIVTYRRITDALSPYFAIYFYTAILCTPIFAVAVDTLGRKVTIMIISVLLVISEFVKLFSTASADVAAFVLVGMVLSGSYLSVPVYIREVCQDSLRRALGSTVLPARFVASMSVYLLIKHVPSYISVLEKCSVVPVILHIIVFVFLPETPEFCVRKQRYDQAARSVAWLRGLDPSDSRVLQRVEQLKSEDAEQTSPLTAILNDNTTLKALSWSLLVMVASALCGFNYAVPRALSIMGDWAIVAVPFVGSIALIFTVQKIGIKRIMAVGTLTVAVCLCVETAWNYLYTGHEASWFIITISLLHVFSYQVALSVLPLVFITEMFSVRLRALALGLALTLFWALRVIAHWIVLRTQAQYLLLILAVKVAILVVWCPETGGGVKCSRQVPSGHQAEDTAL